jgi:lipopolysaccharide assembly LptE-like protein
VNRVLAIGVMLALSGCSEYRYNGPPALPPYIHRLAVRAFTNHTQQYGLEDQLTVAVLSEFNRDGRYQITTEAQADGVVTGDITRYLLEAVSYDANHVPTEYRLTIVAAVSFLDKVKSQTLWTEPDMRGELRYFVASSGFAGAMSETDARQTIYDELARDIRTRTLEGLGGAKETGSTSATESSTGTYVAPRPDNNPPPMPSQEPPPSPGHLSY